MNIKKLGDESIPLTEAMIGEILSGRASLMHRLETWNLQLQKKAQAALEEEIYSDQVTATGDIRTLFGYRDPAGTVAVNMDEIRKRVIKAYQTDYQTLQTARRRIDAVWEAYELLESFPRQVLEAYYILGYGTWEQVADRFHYSDRHIKRIRKQGLSEIAATVNESNNADTPKRVCWAVCLSADGEVISVTEASAEPSETAAGTTTMYVMESRNGQVEKQSKFHRTIVPDDPHDSKSQPESLLPF